MAETILPDWAHFILKMNGLILGNLGIRVKIPWIPEYVELRNKLELMNPVRRWLSFRLRRRLDELRIEQEILIFNATIEAARDA